jgi:3-dehydroquinate synthase
MPERRAGSASNMNPANTLPRDGAGSAHEGRREHIEISLGERSYCIHIGPRLLADPGLLETVITARQLLVVSNETVAPLYLQQLCDALPQRRIASVILPDGEQHKTLEGFARIIDALVRERMNRDAAVLALGGGVVGDMAGFAAACYQRGIDYVQIPTTLLAQVDSSVGGKTAVNHPDAKNMIGAFHQPRVVLADTATLATLPHREYRAGIAEIVKYGLIYDAAFFEWLESHAQALHEREDAAVMYAVRRSCEIKATVVGVDEREHGLRAILNFGHTFGHAIEAASGYGTWLHGEAVAAGMVVAADMSMRVGWLPGEVGTRIIGLLRRFDLPVQAPRIGAERALQAMGLDKKVLGGKLRLVLLRELGRAEVTGEYPASALEATLHEHFN